MLTIDFLIPTIASRAAQTGAVLVDPLPGVRYVLSHQGPTPQHDAMPWSRRGDVTYLRFPHERGLSLNRNRAIQASTAEVCALLDDDCRLAPDAVARIRQAYERHSEAAIILFQALDQDGAPRRRYPPPDHRYSRRKAFHASTIEITFRRPEALARGLAFDERYGINGQFGFGEDILFVADAVSAGLVVVQGEGSYARTLTGSTGDRIRRELSDGDLNTLGAIAVRKWGRLSDAILVKEALRLASFDRISPHGLWSTYEALRSGSTACKALPRRDVGLLEPPAVEN